MYQHKTAAQGRKEAAQEMAASLRRGELRKELGALQAEMDSDPYWMMSDDPRVYAKFSQIERRIREIKQTLYPAADAA